ncbi:hypothetical protein ACJ41O_012575 [Fusarium nematophilum]
MAMPVELLATAVATVIVVLLTTILFRQPAKEPLQTPMIKCLTLRVDDIPTNQTDDLDPNLEAIIEQDPTLLHIDSNVYGTEDRCLADLRSTDYLSCSSILGQQ